MPLSGLELIPDGAMQQMLLHLHLRDLASLSVCTEHCVSCWTGSRRASGRLCCTTTQPTPGMLCSCWLDKVAFSRR